MQTYEIAPREGGTIRKLEVFKACHVQGREFPNAWCWQFKDDPAPHIGFENEIAALQDAVNYVSADIQRNAVLKAMAERARAA